MINKDKNPAEWAAFIYELGDAKEHLINLISDIESDTEYDEANFRIDLEHVYSHLNRAWYNRNKEGKLSDEDWSEASKFPSDLEPS